MPQEIFVPRLHGVTVSYVATDDEGRSRWNGFSVPPVSSVLRPGLATFLDIASVTSFARAQNYRGRLTAQDFTQWRDLGVAALHDVAGRSHEDLCSAAERTDPAKVRAACRRGRRLLHDMGAWP